MRGPSGSRDLSLALCRALLASAAMLVPQERRDEWIAEWSAELTELRRRASRVPRRYGGLAVASLRFTIGAVPHALSELREGWTMDLISQDVKYAARSLLRSPIFTLVALCTLVLGIGANTAIFGMVNGLLHRTPSGVAEPDRLARLGRGEDPDEFDAVSYPVFLALRERARAFEDIAAYGTASAIIGRASDAESVPVQVVSGNYFDVLGVRLARGRAFLPEEDRAPGAGPAVAVIAHPLWRRRFAGDPSVVGRTMQVNGQTFTIIGVAPAGFAGADRLRAAPEVYLPLTLQRVVTARADSMLLHAGNSWLWAVGRLASGVDHARAEAETEVLFDRLRAEIPFLRGSEPRILRGLDARPSERAEVTRIGGLLTGIVVLVLLIACANLASVTLARGLARAGELGVRSALGATRGRLVRQLLTESLLLAVMGAGGALLLSALFAGRMHALLPYDVSAAFTPDGRVLGFTLIVAVGAGVLFGLLPAIRVSRRDVVDALRHAPSRGATAGGWMRQALVAGQIALSFVLLAGAALLARSLHNAQITDPGFRTRDVIALRLDAGRRHGFDATRTQEFFRALVLRARAMPGIVDVGLTESLPIVEEQSSRTPLEPGAVPSFDEPPPPPVFVNTVDEGYFSTLGLALIRGRGFEREVDRTGASPVVVVNERLAERFWPGETPVGRALPFGAPGQAPPRIIGVVRDSRTRSLREEPVPTVYYSLDQQPRGSVTMLVRTSAAPGPVIPSLVRLIEGMDPGLPVRRAATLQSLVAGSLRDTQLTARLTIVFAALALAVAVLGIYGVVAHQVVQRQREFGIRMALGAEPRHILALVLRRGLRVAMTGILVGVAVGIASLRAIEGLLFGIAPTDPPTLAAIALLLSLIALLASWIPARRVMRCDPASTLAPS